MKKTLCWLLCLSLCLALSVCVALADEAPAIHVQLDGQDLTFTDAVPQVKDQRTFLPFRAVFEAMGAQVDYEGSVITAVRGDKTLTMTLDQTTATVTQGEVTTPITMDVAPYVDPATWRTYVPVRFAAQAFGCVVGWDQKAQTAIVIDLDKLLAQAVEGKSFTYLEKLNAMGEKYNEGIWDMTASFDAEVSMLTMPMTMTGTVTGAVRDGDKMAVDMGMKMDMARFMAGMQQMLGATGEVSAEDQAMLDALKNDGVKVTMRGDMSTGKLYMNMDLGVLNTQTKVDPAAWYELDMAALMAQAGMGMDWAALMAQSKSVDMLDTAQLLLSTIEPNDAATGYTQVKANVEALAAALSDEGFKEADGKQTASYTMTADDSSVTLGLALDMDGESVTGYTMDLGMTAKAEGQSVEMRMDISMDDQNKMTARVSMEMGELMTLGMTLDGAYAPGTAAPVTAPPEGATVLDYMELMNSAQSN